MMVNAFKPIQLSIIVPVYNSHRVVKRHIKHYTKMNQSNAIEIIFMDDGSDPPLKEYFINHRLRNFYIYPTGDKRPWSNPCAKNLGVKISEGEYIFITDVDHILPKETVLQAYEFRGDKMGFTRSFAVLSNNGDIFTDPESLFKYGMNKRRYRRRGGRVYQHTNTFVMRKKVFKEIGGYKEYLCNKGIQAHRDDSRLYSDYRKHVAKGRCQPEVTGGEVHVFPASASDPKKLFHRLNRK